MPVLGVSVAVFRGPEVLIVKRGRPPFEGCWSLPGGRVETGETLVDAALRELDEETSVRAEIVGLNRIVEPIRRDATGVVESHFVIVSFVARHISGDGIAGDDAAAIDWCHLGTIAERPTTPELLEIVRAAAQQL